MKLKYYIVIVHILFSLNTFSNQGITKEAWEKKVEKYDYTERYNEINRKEKKIKPARNRPLISPIWLKIIPIILIAILAIIILFVITNNSSLINTTRRLSRKNNFEISDDPDEYNSNELDRFLEDAIQWGDFRLAIRIQFLIIIKLLKDNELIHWKKEKTNFDYLIEIQNAEITSLFKDHLKVFERAWYANYRVDEFAFRGISLKFNTLKTKITA